MMSHQYTNFLILFNPKEHSSELIYAIQSLGIANQFFDGVWHLKTNVSGDEIVDTLCASNDTKNVIITACREIQHIDTPITFQKHINKIWKMPLD